MQQLHAAHPAVPRYPTVLMHLYGDNMSKFPSACVCDDRPLTARVCSASQPSPHSKGTYDEPVDIWPCTCAATLQHRLSDQPKSKVAELGYRTCTVPVDCVTLIEVVIIV